MIPVRQITAGVPAKMRPGETTFVMTRPVFFDARGKLGVSDGTGFRGEFTAGEGVCLFLGAPASLPAFLRFVGEA